MKSSAVLSMLVVVVATTGCKGKDTKEVARNESAHAPAPAAPVSAPPPAVPDATTESLDEKMRHCPLAIPGTRARVVDHAEGVELTITGSASAVDEIRRRADHVVEFAAGRAKANHGGGQGGGTMRNCPVVTSRTQLRVEQIEGGARIVVAPIAPYTVAELKAETSDRVGRFSFDGVTLTRN